jgi:TonB-dependent receptor
LYVRTAALAVVWASLAAGAQAQTNAQAGGSTGATPEQAIPTSRSTQAPTPGSTAGAPSTSAGAAATESANTVSTVVVTGVRASLQSAESIRRNSTDIVDSIEAQDIGQFPDNTVGDALQRITGVQITRAAGEASSVDVRGLPNVETEVNGRSIFTTTGQNVALSDIPAELVQGLDVYKTISADQIEGGIAGVINIRTHRPFDFDGLEVAGTVRGIYGNQRDAIDPNGSILVSDRWNTGIGDVGALVSLSYNRRRYLDEETFNYVDVPGPTNPATGQALQIPQTTGDIASDGDRTRYGANASFQWRPQKNLQFYFDGLYTGYRNLYNNNFFIGIPQAGNITSYTTAPKSNFVNSIAGTNFFTLTSDQAYEARTDTYQGAIGGRYDQGPLTVTSDLSYTYSIYRQRAVILDTRFNAPTYAVNLNENGTPNSTVGGVNILSASSFDLNQLFNDLARQEGSEWAYRIDGTYDVHQFGLKNIVVGVRYDYHSAQNLSTNGDGIPIAAGDNVSAASLPGLGGLSPANFFSNVTPLSVTQWFSANPQYLLSHTDTLRSIFGQPAGEQAYYAPDTFNYMQHTYAGYVKGNYDFDLAGHRVTGDVGVRLVQTDESLQGFEQLPGVVTVTPVITSPTYKNVLPSFNGKIQLTDTIDFRISAGQTVTFPSFASLDPSLALSSPGATLIGTGTSGNPNLQPTTSTNIDTGPEWFFSRSGSVTATYFHRDIKGYIETYAVPEIINGVSYEVSQPESTGSGELQGLELAYQQYYDFLPSWLKGLGSEVNVTYIDAHSQGPLSLNAASVIQPLANVSKYSLNAIGLYERGPFSLRVAYNWRSKYIEAFNAGGDQPQTIVSAPYGDLGLAANYAVNKHLILTVDVENLTQTVSQDYFQNAALYPRDTNVSDRTIEVGLRFKL